MNQQVYHFSFLQIILFFKLILLQKFYSMIYYLEVYSTSYPFPSEMIRIPGVLQLLLLL